MHTGPERFARLAARTVALLANHTELSNQEATVVVQALELEHEVSLRRHAPRLHALLEMGRMLDRC
jgi:hypothetical protein